ncbi:MAG: Gldg family protein [Planctomycetes bacterium]|nr:Gldg family protein [Planctomycetota bacterium]
MSDLRKHAPQANRSPLGIMALISIILGALFFLGYLFSSLQDPELATESESRRLVFLFWAGSFLFVQGVAIGLFHIARDPHFATGATDALAARLQDAPLWKRVLYIPVVVLGHRRARGFANASFQIVLGITLFVLANYLFARHELWRIDVTKSQVFTLSEESRALVEEVEAPIRLLLIVPEAGLNNENPELLRQLRALIAEYREANSLISGEFFNTLSVSDALERQEKLKALGVTGDLTNDQALMGLIVQIGKKDAGEFEVVRSKRVSLDELWQRDPSDRSGRRLAFNGERAITTAILELRDTKKSVIYFLTGHGEPSIGAMGGSGLAYWVERIRERNMEVKALNLVEEDSNAVPDDADLLIVAGPRSQMTKIETAAIATYLKGGGDLIFLAEGRYESAPALGDGVEWLEVGLEDLIRDHYGILCRDRIVSVIREVSGGRQVRTADLEGVFRFSHRHPLVRPIQRGRMYLRTARPLTTLTIKNVITESLLKSLEGRDRAYFGQANPGSRERGKPGPYSFAMAAHAHDSTGKTGPKTPSRVVVVGDLDFATTEFTSQRSNVNLEFLMNAIQWCLERETRIVGKVKIQEPTRLVMTRDQIAQISLVAVFGLPSFAIGLGIVAFAIRRRS